MIDQTLLRPDVGRQEVEIFLKGAAQHEFYAAVVNPCWVEMAVTTLAGMMKVCSVVGFPLGASSTQAKVFAAADLISKGCDEIDMVMNIGRLKDKDFRHVGEEIRRVSEACTGKVLKVIIEACLLSDEEKVAAAKIVQETGAHFVKTSTGFSTGGATVEDVRLLRRTVGKDFGVKASGGIRTYDQACGLVAAGANRLGTSHGIAIVMAAQDSSGSE